MPKGTQSIDVALTNVAVGYKNEEFIATGILPVVPVVKQAGKIYLFGKDAFRLETDVRAPGANANKVQSYSVSTDSYFCDGHALQDTVPLEDLKNVDVAIQPEISVTEGLSHKLMLRREASAAAALFNATTFASYTTALSGTTQWSDYTNSSPLGAADTALDNIRKQSGIKGNTAIMSTPIFLKLKRHPELLDYYKYTTGGVLTKAQIMEAMGLKKLFVGSAIYDSAVEGVTMSGAEVWGDYCLFAYIADRPGLRTPSLGYSYRWTDGVQGYKVYKTIEDEAGSRHAVIIEVQNYFDDVVHGADFGYLYSDVLA